MEWPLAFDHDWNVSTAEARAIQNELAGEVRSEPLGKSPRTIAGIDVSIRGDLAQAAIAVLDVVTLETVDEVIHRMEVPFPYVPGLLSFREMPAILPALRKLRIRPDLLMTDSQGYAHPRRIGLACHLGVVLDWPALGVAKSRLVGSYEEPDVEKGSRSPLVHEDERIGTVLRTRTNVKPVYVSVGHRITLEEAEQITLEVSPKYKIPEPTRRAHHLSRKSD